MITSALILILDLLKYAIIIHVIISWLPIDRENQFVRLINQLTEPVLAPIRGLIQRSEAGRKLMLDISPIIAILLIYVLQNMIVRTFGGGYRFFL